MSIQQSINQALQSGVYAAGIGKGLANQKQIIQQQKEANANQLNILKEMQKKANKNLKMTREAMKEQQKQFNISQASSIIKSPTPTLGEANIGEDITSKYIDLTIFKDSKDLTKEDKEFINAYKSTPKSLLDKGVMVNPLYQNYQKDLNKKESELSKSKENYNKALQEKRDIKSKIKDLEDK